MERGAGMKWRLPALPPASWLALAIASFVAAFVLWQDQRLDRLRPPASAPAAVEESSPPRSTTAETGSAPPVQPTAPGRAGEPDAPAASARTTSGGTATGEATTAVRTPEPQAGRQVLRCVSRGRVTYRDLNAGCPEGATETITVFPTEGVGKPP